MMGVLHPSIAQLRYTLKNGILMEVLLLNLDVLPDQVKAESTCSWTAGQSPDCGRQVD